MDVSKFNLFGVLFNFKDKKARDDHAALAETVGVHGEDIQGLQAPTFSEPAANANVREAVAKVKSGATLGTLFTNVKAALNGLITLGEMRNYLVNNGTVTETGKYFLDAAYGKTLLDQITALNSKIGMLHYPGADSDGIIRVDSLSLNEIGQFIKDCVIKHNAYTKWYSVRVNVKSTDPPLTGGYFNTSSYSIMWCVSSINYGWAIIMSDMNDEKIITFGRLAGGNWHWLKPTLTLVN